MARKKIESASDQRPFSMVYHDFLKSIEHGLLDNHYQVVVYIYLKMFTDSKNQCYPSIKTLHKLTKISTTKIKEVIAELEKKGVITKKNRIRSNGGKSSNLYKLNDYKEIWNAGSMEEIINVIDEIEENQMIELLTAKGYYISKEKGLEPTEPTKVTVEPSTMNYNFYQSNNTPGIEESQAETALEKFPMHQIQEFFGYDAMKHDFPHLANDIDATMEILHDTLNTNKPTIRINGEDKPALVVTSKLMRLDKGSIVYAIEKFQERTNRIKNPKSYMLTLLYNAPEQYTLDITNQVQYDIHKQN